MRNRILCCALVCVALLWGAAAAEPLGFGLVNTDKTNFRKAIGGDILFKQRKGEYVYVADHQQDAQGREWYRVVTDQLANHTTNRVSAWVMAKYITADDALFSDIAQVSAGRDGFLALKRDGTVVGAARENPDTRVFQRTISSWRDIRQVTSGFFCYFAVERDGSLHGFGNAAYEDWEAIKDVRLLDASMLNVVYLTQGGDLGSGLTNADGAALPDAAHIVELAAGHDNWAALLLDDGTARYYGDRALSGYADELESWTGLTAVATACARDDMTAPLDARCAAYAGLRADGTVVVAPKALFAQAERWTDIVAISMADNLLLGLRSDGTVVAAGDNDYRRAEVEGWTDVVAIDASAAYSVGLRRDGTLVWAGTFYE